MNLFSKLKRFNVKNLFVCKVYVADNLQHKYFGMIGGEYVSLWTPLFLGIKILYGNDKILKDPIYGTEYIARANVDALKPEKKLYYHKLENSTDIFKLVIIGKKMISVNKIEKLNSLFQEVYEACKKEEQNKRVAT